ncbi:hypothetical protein AXF42_Ash020799 [Apostasia shenzhenica]|uniref:Uncharacterized protein n=1 Tax=Apostasia shenzhenica TaxID=1088818 RepID=A0A2I0AR57_9ASPA|nr:hypothetical protein AXF42_Ash020799 [Apostasia shenzhenica]
MEYCRLPAVFVTFASRLMAAIVGNAHPIVTNAVLSLLSLPKAGRKACPNSSFAQSFLYRHNCVIGGHHR